MCALWPLARSWWTTPRRVRFLCPTQSHNMNAIGATESKGAKGCRRQRWGNGVLLWVCTCAHLMDNGFIQIVHKIESKSLRAARIKNALIPKPVHVYVQSLCATARIIHLCSLTCACMWWTLNTLHYIHTHRLWAHTHIDIWAVLYLFSFYLSQFVGGAFENIYTHAHKRTRVHTQQSQTRPQSCVPTPHTPQRS